ncbi:MAG TPA: ornithine carbamoyltransferase [Myxococcales bacterium]|nr:ornithine carbamoyltransferase [Myxococcales bacterium]
MSNHFLTLSDLSQERHRRLFDRAAELKARRRRGERDVTLAGRTLVLIFEKASTRTRLSFEAAIGQLGGQAITLSTSDSQLSRGESWSDTAKVISGYADAVMIRTFADERLQEFARASAVPVINGLTDGGHPVQLVADLFTVQERLGAVEGKVVAWVGDGSSNMARSWVEAAKLFDFQLRICAPAGYRPPPELLHDRAKLVETPEQAAAGADVVTTDVWTSMGQEKEAQARRQAFSGYQVDAALMARAQTGAIFLHCLPAHRGEEVSADVLDGPRSAAWDEAENRMHVQKALLEALILAQAS